MADEATLDTVTTEATATTPNDAAPAAEPAKTEAVATLDDATILGGDTKPVEAAPAEAAPETYELTVPEGMSLHPEDVAVFEPVARELGLTNENANKLMPVAAKFAERVQAATQSAIVADVLAQRAAWASEARADAEIGGTPEHHETVKAIAAKALDRFGGDTLRSFLNESGLGNHPDLIRFAYRAGKSISEDADFHRADAAAKPTLTREQKFYGVKTAA